MNESNTATRDAERESVIFRCDVALKEELARRAHEHDRSVGAEVRQLLKAAIAREEETA